MRGSWRFAFIFAFVACGDARVADTPSSAESRDGGADASEGSAGSDAAADGGEHEPANADASSASADSAAATEDAASPPAKSDASTDEPSTANTDAGAPEPDAAQPDAPPGLEHGSLADLAGGAGIQLAFRVVDAEYTRVSDRIVLIADEPDRLLILDPETGDYRAVALPHTPLAVSVQPDGKLAAVAHNRAVSIVDLERAQLLNTFPMFVDPGDVVLAGDGYAYAFSRENTWSQIDAIELATGRESFGEGPVYGGAHARLHPAGDRMYGAEHGGSPTDIERYDFASQPVRIAYDSPYHGEYPMCGDLWFTEDGSRIVTACGYTFNASNLADTDLRYRASIEGNPTIMHLDHSRAAGVVALVHSDTRPALGPGNVTIHDVSLYEDKYLNWRQTVRLPSFVVADKPYAAEGLFTFFNRAGTRLFVLVRADAQAPTVYRFGLARYSITPQSTAQRPISSVLDPEPQPTPPLSTSRGRVLAFEVIDAEYSRALDRIVAVRADPDMLLLLDPANDTGLGIALPLPPRSVALSADGLRAAVGHDGWVSSVDLQSHTVLATVATSAVVGDVALAPGSLAYAFPARDQWMTAHAVDFTTGVGTDTGIAIYAGARVGMHPSGDRLYGSDNTDIWRIDVGISPMQLIRPEPPATSVSHSACANVWLSTDGARIFTACGEVYRASNVHSEDMQYLSTLAGSPHLIHLDHSPAAKLVAAALRRTPTSEPQPPGQVQLFDEATLQLRGTLDLPSVSWQNSNYPSIGQQVFFSADGEQLRVLARIDASGVYPAPPAHAVLLSVAVRDVAP